MDKQRVKEIVTSPIMANVTYNGSPVYIEQVNRTSANIHYLNNPDQKLKVSINSLVEH